METDRNLLFALIALQLEFINSERFNVICSDWSATKEAPLPKMMLDRGWITAKQHQQIERRLELRIAEHGEDAAKTLALEATVDVRNILQTVAQGNIEETVDSADRSSSTSESRDQRLDVTTAMESDSGSASDSAGSEATQDYGPEDAGYVQMETMDYERDGERSRYTFTRMHGEGGIGRVWLAHDQHLNRQVALKEIRPDKEQSRTAWTRFVREAQITSQLEHPNIVPVYELSNRSDHEGSFYTMRFVRGDTLRNAIDDYHRHRREGTATELELRSLLNSFVLVCHAIGFAHSRGVLHRDLKPSNVMVGSFGEVVVLDWGLAKMVDSADDDDDDLMQAGPVSVTEEGEVNATQQGAILGTLPYMAPEQAAGRVDKVDSRTDVYGLGAILYAVLTGNHPHKGTTTREVRSRILKEPTPRVRSEDKSAHPVLDAICGKAMEKERGNRYSKASELADDVQRWLADEPVACYRESLLTRSTRWLRKHRTWAQALAGSLLLIAAVSVAAALMIQRARTREELAHAETRKAKAVATELFQESRETVDKMVTGVNDALRDFPSMQPMRRRLLEEAARKYESFLEREGMDLPQQVEAARTLVRLADVYRELDQLEEAEQRYRDAEAQLKKIVATHVDSREARIELVNTLMKLGLFYAKQHEAEAALAMYDEADAQLDASKAVVDPDGELRLLRAGLRINRANLLKDTGKTDEAFELLKEAIEEFASLTNEFDDAKFVDGLATARTQFGGILQSVGRNSEAIEPITLAVNAFEQLSREYPDSHNYQKRLADARLNLAAAMRTLGRDREERETYRQALEDYELLMADRSDVPRYQQERALAKIDLALALYLVGNTGEARDLLLAATTELDDLANSRVALATYYEYWAFGMSILGRAFGERDQPGDAMPCFEDAIESYEWLIKADPHFSDKYRSQLAGCRTAHGVQFHLIGEAETSRTTLAKAIDEFRGLISETPDNRAHRHSLAWALTHLAEVEWETGNQPKAISHYQEAIALREELPTEPEHRYAFTKLLLNCPDPDLADADRAIQLAQEITALAPQNPRYATVLGAAYYRADQIDEAIKTLEAVDDLSPQGGSEHQFWLVLAYHAKGGEQNENRAQNRLQAAVTQMELEVPARRDLLRLRADAEAALSSAQ